MCVLGQGRDILEFWDLRLESQANVDASLNQQEEKQQCGLQFETKGNCQGLENEGKQLLLQEECRGISSQCDLKIPGMTFSLG